MLGPIPNSLTAGAYNGSFIPHGLVTFSGRSFFVKVRQEVCLFAVLDPDLPLVAILNPSIVAAARLDQAFTTASRIDDNLVTDAELLQTLAFDAIIEDC
jgi:hypothetical protein